MIARPRPQIHSQLVVQLPGAMRVRFSIRRSLRGMLGASTTLAGSSNKRLHWIPSTVKRIIFAGSRTAPPLTGSRTGIGIGRASSERGCYTSSGHSGIRAVSSGLKQPIEMDSSMALTGSGSKMGRWKLWENTVAVRVPDDGNGGTSRDRYGHKAFMTKDRG